MNYFFTPFPIIDQYQSFYSFVPQMFIETKTYYTEEPILEKQISILKSQNSTLEPQLPSKPIDQHVSSYRKTKKTKKREDKNFGFREQDKQRNIFSNILKGFFVALSQKRAMDAFIRQTQPGNEAHLDLEEFHTKVFQIFKKCKSYFSPKSVRQILKGEKDEEGVRNIVKRCLYYYLKTQFPINLLLSKRIKRKSKLLQMRKARQLLSTLRENQ